MKEILFRAYIEDESKMVYPGDRNYFLLNDGRLFRVVELSDRKGHDVLCLETKAVIEQYIGLKDKNGKKIFEGDIPGNRFSITTDWDMNIDKRTLFVVEKRDGCFVSSKTGMTVHDTIRSIANESDIWTDYEVIGNIHDNPELLEIKK